MGAIYLNYAATVLIAISGYFALDHLAGLSIGRQLILWGTFSVVFPVWFFPYSKSLWLSLDYFFDPKVE